MDIVLTERQQEIKNLLETGLTAREVAEQLGISRNAVYQQIQRMRQTGALPANFTPTGQPVREMRPGANLLHQLLGASSNGHEVNPERAAAMALAQELQRTRDELRDIALRLTSIVG